MEENYRVELKDLVFNKVDNALRKEVLNKWLNLINNKDYKKGNDIPIKVIDGRMIPCFWGEEDIIFKNCSMEIKCDEENNTEEDEDKEISNVTLDYTFYNKKSRDGY